MLGASSCLQIRNGLISGQGTILVSAGTPSSSSSCGWDIVRVAPSVSCLDCVHAELCPLL